MTHPTRVLIVDDSAMVRSVLQHHLNSQEDLEVVGTAKDPFEARDLIQAVAPEVICLDVEMPRMDGLTFLGKLMAQHPLPVVMVSSVTPKQSAKAVEALEIGAVDVVHKPTGGGPAAIRGMLDEVVAAVRTAKQAKLRRYQPPPRVASETGHRPASTGVIALGASTGGIQALHDVLSRVPADVFGIVVVQHLPDGFVERFAQRLDETTRLEVRVATDGDTIRRGHVLIAPGDRQMRVRRRGTGWSVSLGETDRVSGHCPSVDVLFRSVAEAVGPRAVGALLTGMGSDGAEGLGRIRAAGGRTFAQSEETCVVYGMPRAAVALGAVEATLGPEEIAKRLLLHGRPAEGATPDTRSVCRPKTANDTDESAVKPSARGPNQVSDGFDSRSG